MRHPDSDYPSVGASLLFIEAYLLPGGGEVGTVSDHLVPREPIVKPD